MPETALKDYREGEESPGAADGRRRAPAGPPGRQAEGRNQPATVLTEVRGTFLKRTRILSTILQFIWMRIQLKPIYLLL